MGDSSEMIGDTSSQQKTCDGKIAFREEISHDHHERKSRHQEGNKMSQENAQNFENFKS
jgi:hypothetical protein